MDSYLIGVQRELKNITMVYHHLDDAKAEYEHLKSYAEARNIEYLKEKYDG